MSDLEEQKQGTSNQIQERQVKKKKQKKVDSMTIDADFELVDANDAYFHSVKGLLNQYLDGLEQLSLDLSTLAGIQYSLVISI